MKVVNGLIEVNNPDFWYTAGSMEYSKENLSKANEYFKQALYCLEINESILITEGSNSLYEILYAGTKEHDVELINKKKDILNPRIFKKKYYLNLSLWEI
jgi:outer membrane protein assembly factor BamD (BamD/ComL family)